MKENLISQDTNENLISQKENENLIFQNTDDNSIPQKTNENIIIEKIYNDEIEPLKDNKTHLKCYRCTGDVMMGITFLGRIIITLYTFHGLFFVYNLIFQYIVLFAGVLYDIKTRFFQIIMAFIYILFSLSAGNILVIPTYEFLTFPFITYRNPFIHLMSFTYIVKNAKFRTDIALKKNSNLVNVFLIIIEIAYFLGFICVWLSITTTIKDYCKFIILCLIYVYYLLIIFSYCIMLIFIIIKLLISSYQDYERIKKNQKDIKENCLNKYWKVFKNAILDLDIFFAKREELPDVNLLSYVISPYLMKNYEFRDGTQFEKKHMYDYCDNISFIQKLLLLILTILVFFILTFNNSSSVNIFALLSFIFLFVVMSILSIGINFPFCFRNKKTFGHFFASIKFRYKLKIRHPIMVPLIRFISNTIVILICFALVGIFFFKEDADYPIDINYLDFNETNEDNIPHYTKNKLLPNMCFSSLYYFSIPSFLPFINDAYYYINNTSSLQNKKYRDLFFTKEYQIDIFGDLIENLNSTDSEKNSVKMIQYNVKGDRTQITILSIKGTSYKKDIFLDIQLYFPSVLLNILSTFSLSQKDSLSNKLIEYSLSIPYRVFFQFLIIDKYINLLYNAYFKNSHNFYKDIIVVGHSLGGGLAKILGKFLKIQAISLSGPGMNAFNSLWSYRGDSEYFGISSIDLVPDMDLVPRVEVSGGTIYRIICISGVFGCHGKERSLCEVLIMCRHPSFKEYCSKVALLDDEEIKKLYDNTELNED